MNSLSWVIYTAGLVDRAGFAAISILLFFIIYQVTRFIVYVMLLDNEYDKDKKEDYGDKSKKCIEKAFLLSFFFIPLSLLPTKEEIYLISGSEAAERVVTSEDGQEILEDIKTIIKNKVENLKDG